MVGVARVRFRSRVSLGFKSVDAIVDILPAVIDPARRRLSHDIACR